MAKSARSKAKIAHRNNMRKELYYRSVDRQKRLAVVGRTFDGSSSSISTKMDVDTTNQINLKAGSEVKLVAQAKKKFLGTDDSHVEITQALCTAILKQKTRPVWMNDKSFKKAKDNLRKKGRTKVEGIGKIGKKIKGKRAIKKRQ